MVASDVLGPSKHSQTEFLAHCPTNGVSYQWLEIEYSITSWNWCVETQFFIFGKILTNILPAVTWMNGLENHFFRTSMRCLNWIHGRMNTWLTTPISDKECHQTVDILQMRIGRKMNVNKCNQYTSYLQSSKKSSVGWVWCPPCQETPFNIHNTYIAICIYIYNMHISYIYICIYIHSIS